MTRKIRATRNPRTGLAERTPLLEGSRLDVAAAVATVNP
jgi:hypothetical protein